jgi:predicted nucleic acid-binding protein
MKLYFDTCCYSRPYDDQAHQEQERVWAEIVAILAIIRICKLAGYGIVGSIAVIDEISDIIEVKKFQNVMGLYRRTVNEYIPISADIRSRAQWLMARGLKEYDSFHLAFSEAAGVDFLLTTDIRFEKKCARNNFSMVNIINPSNFLPEVVRWVQ